MADSLPDYFELPLRRFVEDTEAREPTPGGGSVTAMSAVLGCALARMTAAYTLGNEKLADAHAEVGRLDARLAEAERVFRGLVLEDMEAYLAYEASRRHAAGASPGRQQGKQATLAALAVPTEMVALASTALKTCDELKETISKYLLSDLLAAAHLLHGAAFAAAANARLNLRSVAEARVAETYRTQITSALAHADLHLSSISSAISKKLSLPS